VENICPALNGVFEGHKKIIDLNFSVLSARDFSHKYAKQSLSLIKNGFINLSLTWKGGSST